MSRHLHLAAVRRSMSPQSSGRDVQDGGEQHEETAGVAVDAEVLFHAVVQEDVDLQLHVQQLVRGEGSAQTVQVPTDKALIKVTDSCFQP